MSKGYEDWGVNLQALSYQNTDIGELAVKLGYGDAISRSGKLAWQHQFDIDYQGFSSSVNGSNSSIEHRNDDGYTSPGVMRLVCDTASNNFSLAKRNIALYGQRSMGFAIYAKFVTTVSKFYLYTRVYDNGTLHRATLQLDGGPNTIALRNTSGTFTTIEDEWRLQVGQTSYFNYIKFSIDLNTSKYLFAQLNNVIYDVRTISYQTEATVLNNLIEFNIECDGNGTSGMTTDIDSCYYTIDEPTDQ